MSRTFTLSGDTSVLSANFYPPIELDTSKSYGLGLYGFYTYNSIFNVHEGNNGLIFKTSVIRVPPGAYEIDEINRTIQRLIAASNPDLTEDIESIFTIRANTNTLKCEITSKYDFDMRCPKSIAALLGFEAKRFEGGSKVYESSSPVDIIKIRIISVDCNITSGAYVNDSEAHTIFDFDIDVEPGFKISKEPQNVIYMPIRPYGRQFIDNITLRILDDGGNLVDFRGEKIIIKLELKQL